jgi:hypothetical protein
VAEQALYIPDELIIYSHLTNQLIDGRGRYDAGGSTIRSVLYHQHVLLCNINKQKKDETNACRPPSRQLHIVPFLAFTSAAVPVASALDHLPSPSLIKPNARGNCAHRHSGSFLDSLDPAASSCFVMPKPIHPSPRSPSALPSSMAPCSCRYFVPVPVTLATSRVFG